MLQGWNKTPVKVYAPLQSCLDINVDSPSRLGNVCPLIDETGLIWMTLRRHDIETFQTAFSCSLRMRHLKMKILRRRFM